MRAPSRAQEAAPVRPTSPALTLSIRIGRPVTRCTRPSLRSDPRRPAALPHPIVVNRGVRHDGVVCSLFRRVKAHPFVVSANPLARAPAAKEASGPDGLAWGLCPLGSYGSFLMGFRQRFAADAVRSREVLWLST